MDFFQPYFTLSKGDPKLRISVAVGYADHDWSKILASLRERRVRIYNRFSVRIQAETIS